MPANMNYWDHHEQLIQMIYHDNVASLIVFREPLRHNKNINHTS